MIHAIVQNGEIRPLEPLPAEWSEGLHVIGEDADVTSVQELEAWYLELQSLGPAEYEPCERQHMHKVLNEADEQAKALVRCETVSN